MDTGGLIWTYFFLVVSVCACAVSGSAIATSVINCDEGGHKEFGPVAEEFSGDVELVTGITAGSNVKLVPYIFPAHLEFLELNFTVGETTATVHTKRPLDADVLIASDTILYYSIMCDGEIKFNNTRKLKLADMNDNRPIFTQKLYSINVSETTPVDTTILQVKAEDADSTPENSAMVYSMAPTSEDFMMTSSGALILKRPLNYNVVQSYRFTVTAKDRSGFSDTTTVQINVEDVDNLNPYFLHNLYQAFIPENHAGLFRTIQPEAIKALDGDTGINTTLTYSISSVTPEKYRADFDIDSISGVVSVVTFIDREEMNSSTISVNIKAAQTDNLFKTADAVVSVSVEDVNDNAPEFEQPPYIGTVLENSPVGTVVLNVTVTDLDQGGFVGTLQIVTESVPFSISSDGTVTVRNSTALDREAMETVTFQVLAVDQVTDGLTATAWFTIVLLDVNDNAPQFPDIPDPLYISEGVYSEEAPGEVFTIRPTDADAGSNGEVSLSLVSHDPLFRFREDGMLLAVGALDRENRETYDLVINASDKGSPQRENITTIRVSLTDDNDNAPEFNSSSYVSTILLKDAEKGKVVLTLYATDKDAGNNSLITYSFYEGSSPYLALNSETGEVSLTSDLADVITEDTTVNLTAMAKDNGRPPLNSTARVVVELRVTSLENVTFQSSSYNFSLPENEPAGVTVGNVSASAGSDLYSVAYSLKTHTDVFSINANGAILTKTELDKETQEWYILDVEAVDTRDPPTSATAMVQVLVEDVNEAPQFPHEVYKASVFSTDPYKTPVIQVKASDPDVVDEDQLEYSLVSGSPYFDVDVSSGLVFVVSVVELEEEKATVEVKVTDPRGLHARAKVEVAVLGSTSRNDVVTISLNQPANVVERKIPEMEKSLGKALGWTVDIIEVSNSTRGSPKSRTLREAAKSLVNFIAVDKAEVVSYEEVVKKLQSESAAVTDELTTVFGEDVQFAVVQRPENPDFNWQAVVIPVSVIVPVIIVVLTVVLTRFKKRIRRKKKRRRESKAEAICF